MCFFFVIQFIAESRPIHNRFGRQFILRLWRVQRFGECFFSHFSPSHHPHFVLNHILLLLLLLRSLHWLTHTHTTHFRSGKLVSLIKSTNKTASAWAEFGEITIFQKSKFSFALHRTRLHLIYRFNTGQRVILRLFFLSWNMQRSLFLASNCCCEPLFFFPPVCRGFMHKFYRSRLCVIRMQSQRTSDD